MKKFTNICFLIVFLTSFTTYSQTSSNKKYSYDYLNYPSVKIDNAMTFELKIHPGSLALKEAGLKGNKARKILESYTEGRAYFSFNDLRLGAEDSDLSVDISFGDFTIVNTVLKNDHEIGCARVGAKLNSVENIKKNLKMCPAVYYSLEYGFPYILKITNKAGETLFIKSYADTHWSTFGYDSTGLTGFLKQEDLDAAYSTSDHSKIKREAGLNNIAESLRTIYESLFFKQETDVYKFGTGKGGGFDYSKLSSTLNNVLAAFKSNSNVKPTLETAISLWEMEIETVDLGNRKARINRKVATSIYGNLTLAHMYLNNFDAALTYSKEYLRLANMAGDQAIPERAKSIYYRVKNRSSNYKTNSESLQLTQEPIPAPLLSYFLNTKKEASFTFVTTENNYETFLQEIEVEEEEKTEGTTLLDLLTAKMPAYDNDLDKYRSRIQFTQLQGNALFLNNWYDKDIEGKTLPIEICQLTELNELRPYGLSLISLPDEIGNLVNLKKLDLSGNALTKIPSSIGNLENLKVLDLSNNKLTNLPESIKGLKNLQKLKLKGNTFSKSDLEALKALLPKKCKIKT